MDEFQKNLEELPRILKIQNSLYVYVWPNMCIDTPEHCMGMEISSIREESQFYNHLIHCPMTIKKSVSIKN